MIKLTRLNGKTFYLNALLIETIESFPDTTIQLTNGKKYVVQESEEVVVKMTNLFYQRIQLFPLDQQKGEDVLE